MTALTKLPAHPPTLSRKVNGGIRMFSDPLNRDDCSRELRSLGCELLTAWVLVVVALAVVLAL